MIIYIIFPSGHQKVHSSLSSGLLYTRCAESACMQTYFLHFTQVLLVLESFGNCVFSRYAVSQTRNPAAPWKSSFDSVFRHSSPYLFHSIWQRHCRCSHHWCWRKLQGANGKSCIGSCMWLWPCPGFQLLTLFRCGPKPFASFCLLWCSGQHICAWCSSAGPLSLSWDNRRRQWLCQWRQTLKMSPSCSWLQAALREALACFFSLYSTW